ncbi:hypothetical protein Tco_0585733 [Tanacetum coccineum]
MVAYLQKSEGSEGFHQIIDFLNASHIRYTLTENPTIYVSFIKQFWRTTTARTSANGEVELTATIDGQVKTITEASLRIFSYSKGKPTLGLWYSRNSPFELVDYTDSDYARATQDRKSTTRGCQFLGNRLISWQCKKQIVVATSTTEAEFKNEWKDLLHQTKSVKYIGNSKEVGTLRYLSLVVSLKMVGDEAVHKELGDRMERVATTASTLKAEQNSSAQTRFETTSKQSNDPTFLRVNTLGSREDSIKLMKLMAHCTKLSALVSSKE